MKRIMLLPMLFFFAVCAKAQAQPSTLVLWHANGTQTKVQLFTRPQVTFSSDSIHVVSPVVTINIPASDILRFTYEGLYTGVRDTGDGEVFAQQKGENIYFCGVASEREVTLLTADGKRLPVNLTRSGSVCRLSMSALPKGAYLLTVKGKTAKFIRK